MLGLPDSYLAYLMMPFGYLMGSIPGAYIIGRLIGKFDLREEGDGRISAAAIYKRLGRWPFILVVIVDVGKGMLSVVLTTVLTGSLILALLVGFAAVIGHNWSIFLKFQGGLGATVTWGVLGGIAVIQLLIAFIPAIIIIITTRKSGWATGITIVCLTLILLLQKIFGWNIPPYTITTYLITYPIVLILFMLLKKRQIKKNSASNSE